MAGEEYDYVGEFLKYGLFMAGLVALTLSGCSSASGTAAPTVTVTVTQPPVTVTASPAATPTTAANGPLALGASATSSSGGTVTVYEHRKNVEPQDPKQEAIDVKVCVAAESPTAAPEDYPVITTGPWTLYDAESRLYSPASTRWSHEGAQPGYPTEQRVAWGDCIRGWVIIQGEPSVPMTKVRYTAGTSILEWKLTP